MPRGFYIKIQIISTWGDIHFCGLNGIEFYDYRGERIIKNKLCEFKIAAEPSSVKEKKKIYIYIIS